MYDPVVLFPEAVTLIDHVRRQEMAEEMRRVTGYRRLLAVPPAEGRAQRMRRDGYLTPLTAGGDRCAAAA